MGRSINPKRLYFMRAIGTDLIKIGCSREPEKRLKELVRVSPIPLDIVLMVPGGHAEEWLIHRTFKSCKSHSEWFHSTAQLEALIISLREGKDLVSLIGAPPAKEDRLRFIRASTLHKLETVMPKKRRTA